MTEKVIDVYDYVVEKLRKNKKVNIEVTGKKTKSGFMQMDWLIDKKLLLEDFPYEVFEGEVIAQSIVKGKLQ